jgi:hypothetical protein
VVGLDVGLAVGMELIDGTRLELGIILGLILGFKLGIELG